MSLRDKIEASPIFYVLSCVVASFAAGFAANFGIMQAAGMDLVQKGSYILREDVDQNYLSKDDVQARYIERTEVLAGYVPKDRLNAGSGLLAKPAGAAMPGSIVPANTAGEPASSASHIAQVQEAEDFRFSLGGCERKSEEVVCRVLITNEGEERHLRLLANSLYPQCSRVIDSDGLEALSNQASLGSRKGETPSSLMPRGVGIEAQLRFPGASIQSSNLSLLQVGFSLSALKNFEVSFRNVRIAG